MELGEYFRVLARRKGWVLASVLVGLLLASAASILMPRTYQAESRLVFGIEGSKTITDLSSGQTFLGETVKTYAAIGNSSMILDPAVARVGGAPSPDVARHIKVSQEPDTLVLQITAEDKTAGRAVALANAVADQMIASLPQISQVQSPSEGRVTAKVVTSATVGSTNLSPSTSTLIIVGVVAGLLVGMAVAVIVDYASKSRKRRRPEARSSR